jgi:uncharacterized protein with FMN-binding domain
MSDQSRTKIIGLIVIVLLTTVGTVSAVAYNNRPPSAHVVVANNTATASASAAPTTGTTSPGAPSSSSTTYKDGTYTANGTFYTPNGAEHIGVTLTLVSNNITTVSIDSSSITSGTSYEYTSLFTDGINQAVDGRNVNDVQVGRISGASLTPIGFNNALQIKNDARA